jgi:hypothetical protein
MQCTWSAPVLGVTHRYTSSGRRFQGPRSLWAWCLAGFTPSALPIQNIRALCGPSGSHVGAITKQHKYAMSSKDIFQLPKSNPKLVSILSRCYSHAAVSEEVIANLARRSTQLASEPSTDSESLALASTFTAAQLSRAAAQAVRLSIQQGQLKDAYYVVTSLQASWDPPVEGELPKHRFRYPKFKPISFGQRVSPRLATHALLHGLMRVGLSVKAAQCAEYLMRDGFNIRSTTLQVTIRNIVPAPPPGVVQADALDRSRSIDSADILTLRSSMVSDRCTRCAVRLLIQAKKYRQRRTQDMFDFLIHICLLQGELIVGSLLFAMLVKIMHVQIAFSAQMKMESQATTAETGVTVEQKQAFRKRFNLHRDKCLVHPDASLFPRKSLLHAILEAIESNLSQDPQDEEAAQAFCATLQALANIAMLLDQGRLPQADISHLIHALYTCPKVKNEVWIRRNGVPVRIVAYSYFHEVLKRLITTLPPQPLTRIIKNPAFRPLNITSCNSLLHYSLRHRLSPALGSKVLQYMTAGRRPPLEPDTVTYNILIRSGTLSRKMDMTEAALHALRLRKENEDHGIMVEGPISLAFQTRIPSADLPEHNTKSTFRFSTTLSRLQEETLLVPINTQSSIPLHADSTTLSSYIAHLASTGQASIVATILFHVLPELVVVDHPSWGSMTPKQRTQIRQDSRQACLQRAVMYGPFFFSSVLNALRKAGKTGLAERVWLLAKQAERASWIDGFSPGARPWCLPVQAYTTMLQCYAAEARNGLNMRQANKNKRHARVLDDTHKWKPRTEHSRVRGWAQFILRRNQIKGQPDDSRLGLLLFLSMRAGAREIHNTLMHIQHLVKSQAIISHVQHPQPDARFFNAALELAARRPHMQARATRTKRPHWRRKLRFTHRWYAKSGTASSHWNPFLQEIAEAMVRAGFSVPPGLRYMFVGRYMLGASHFEHAKELERRPFTFPHAQSPTFRPHSLLTTKSRGLPVRRRGRSPPSSLV